MYQRERAGEHTRRAESRRVLFEREVQLGSSPSAAQDCTHKEHHSGGSSSVLGGLLGVNVEQVDKHAGHDEGKGLNRSA